jgi:hypothetical protein
MLLMTIDDTGNMNLYKNRKYCTEWNREENHIPKKRIHNMIPIDNRIENIHFNYYFINMKIMELIHFIIRSIYKMFVV